MSFTQGSPTQTLSIQASNVFVFGGSVAGNAFTVQQLSTGSIASFQTPSGSTALAINNAGNVGIGVTNPAFALQVSGVINASSNLNSPTMNATTSNAASIIATTGFYGPLLGSNAIVGSALYGPLLGSNAIVGSALYGPVTGSNTVSCTSITSTGGTIQTSYSQGTNAPNAGQAYFYNPSNSANQDASVNARIAGSTARNAYYSVDVNGVAGYSWGITGSSQNLVFRASWDFSSGTLFTLDRSGNFTASASVAANSDRRIKKNLKVIPNALEKVKKLKGYTYERTDLPGKFTGVVAQEVLEVLPEAVLKDENGMYSVTYGNLVGLLIEALNEESKKRESLEAMVKELVSKQ
jgi:Chaperone of endosialidase